MSSKNVKKNDIKYSDSLAKDNYENYEKNKVVLCVQQSSLLARNVNLWEMKCIRNSLFKTKTKKTFYLNAFKSSIYVRLQTSEKT